MYIYLIIYIIKETSNTFLFFINDNSIKNNALAEIKDLERKLSEEHDKNKNLNQIVQNHNKSNRIEELENEIKLFRTYYKFSPDEKLISIQFIHSPDINYTIIAKNTDDFVKIEKELYDKYPNYKNFENNFLLNGKKINKYKTLKENNIKNNDIIYLFNK